MWAKNVTNTPPGNFRSINGNSDELIGIGRCIKAGFACSKVEVTNGRYDAVIDPGNGKLIRVQIKGTSGIRIGFTGGSRSGQQISRNVPQRTYKYGPADCDLILGVDGNNGDCYIIPIKDVAKLGSSISLVKAKKYKENWNILKSMAKL